MNGCVLRDVRSNSCNVEERAMCRDQNQLILLIELAGKRVRVAKRI